MGKYLILIILLSLISCNENKTKTDLYKNGNIKSIHYYGKNKIIDSSYYFSEDQRLNQIVHYVKNDSINFVTEFDEEGNKYAEGNILKKNTDFRIGKWHQYGGKKTDSIVEYINVDGEPYINQIWLLDKRTKDTIRTEGNFYYIFNKDSVAVNDTLEYRFYLYQPLYSYDSDMMIILPETDHELKEDFSNFHEIEKDTFFSLENDGIPHPEVPEEIPQNHNANFGIIYSKPGKKRIRGYIAEKIIDWKDTTERIERRLFFDKTIFVKDTVN